MFDQIPPALVIFPVAMVPFGELGLSIPVAIHTDIIDGEVED